MDGSQIEIGTDAWRVARRKTVGGSEVAALFGLSPYTTRLALWHQKNGTLPETDLSDDERVLWGQILEPAIAVGIQRRTKWRMDRAQRYVFHPRIAGMGASLDYLAEHPQKGWGIVEIKNVDGLVFRGWEEGEPPLSFQLQVQHGLACQPEFSWGAVAPLIGGNRLEIFEYDRHPATIAKIEAEVAAFWQSIRDVKEPPADFGADLDTLKALHREADAETRDLTSSNRLPIVCAEYKAAGADEAAAKGRKDAAHAEVLSLIGSAGLAVTKGWRIKSSNVAGGPVSYQRAPYRRITITESKPKE